MAMSAPVRQGACCPSVRWSADGNVLQLLYNRAHGIIVFWRRSRFTYVEMLVRHDALDKIQKLDGIIRCPDIDIQCVYLV